MTPPAIIHYVVVTLMISTVKFWFVHRVSIAARIIERKQIKTSMLTVVNLANTFVFDIFPNVGGDENGFPFNS